MPGGAVRSGKGLMSAFRRTMLLGMLAVAGLAAAAVCGCGDEPAPAPWEPPRHPISQESLPGRQPEREAFTYDPEAVYEAVVTTSLGEFRLGFYPDEAPKAVENFIMLAADWHLYDGVIFHRVVADDFVQTGDPTGTGLSGPGQRYSGPKGTFSGKDLAEFTSRPFVAGTVGMARRSDDPYSADSQWFVCLRRKPSCDGRRAAFAHVTSGLDVVRRISRVEVEGDRAIHPSRRDRPVDPPVIRSIRIVRVGGPARPPEPTLPSPR